MYGTEFANHARAFFDTYAKENNLSGHMSRVATIAANPDQSKHLVRAVAVWLHIFVVVSHSHSFLSIENGDTQLRKRRR